MSYGTLTPRRPQPITISSKQEAYELLENPDSGFDPEEDVADEVSAQHVYEALSRQRGDLDAQEDTIGNIARREWLSSTMSEISRKWSI